MLVGGKEYPTPTPPPPPPPFLYPCPPFPARPFTLFTYFRILSYTEDSPAWHLLHSNHFADQWWPKNVEII